MNKNFREIATDLHKIASMLDEYQVPTAETSEDTEKSFQEIVGWLSRILQSLEVASTPSDSTN